MLLVCFNVNRSFKIITRLLVQSGLSYEYRQIYTEFNTRRGKVEVKNGGGKCSSTRVPTALTRITDLERVRACKIVHRKRVYVRARVCRECLHSYS